MTTKLDAIGGDGCKVTLETLTKSPPDYRA